MSLHLDASPDVIAPTVLLPGDPLRARHLAETYLTDPVCHNQRRAAYGYTGQYSGRRLSIQSTGMGMPSMAIYAHELIREYGVRRLIRIGTCGALQPGLKLGTLVVAMAASTDSSFNRLVFQGQDFAPTASPQLFCHACQRVAERGLSAAIGTVLTSDHFYADPARYRIWIEHGVLAAEMETAALYSVAARERVEALALLTVSDEIRSGRAMDPRERERSLTEMVELALELAL